MSEAALACAAPRASTPRFVALWLPQTLAMTARGLTTFALDVWVYQQTQSATLFALLALSGMLPGVLAAPLIGSVVDRMGARRALLLADLAAVCVTLALLLLFRAERVTPGVLYLSIGAGAFFTALQWPAYTALVTLLAPRQHLPRAAALMQLGYAGQQVIAPALAGWLLSSLNVSALIELDALASLLALASFALLPVHVPAAGEAAGVWRALREALGLIQRQGLLQLAAYISASYLPGGFVLVLATPLALSIAGPDTLGVVMSVMGAGMLLGSVTASSLTRAEGGIHRLLRYDALLATAMLAAGIATHPALVAALGFLFLFGLGGIMAEEQAVWQLRIPAAMQGKVFALRRVLTWASLPAAYALAGPLADHVFVPALSDGGALASSVGSWFGTGRARGIALLLMCSGLVKASVIAWGARDRKLRALNAPPSDALAG